MFDNVYNVAGAASGTVKGVAEVGKKEAKVATSSLTSHVLDTLTHLQAAVGARARNTANKLYSLAGALSGVVNGAKYAGLCFWWYITEDDYKIKLIQSSPVKYKLKDLESLVQNNSNTVGMPPQYHQSHNNGNGVSSNAAVSIGAPVTSSNDHLPEHNIEIRRRSEDFGTSIDTSIKKTVASKSKATSASSGAQAKDRRGHKKKSLPTTPQQEEEYSPRVLA